MAVNVLSTKAPDIVSTVWYCFCYVLINERMLTTVSLLTSINIFANVHESIYVTEKSEFVSYFITYWDKQLNNIKLTKTCHSNRVHHYIKNTFGKPFEAVQNIFALSLQAEQHVAPCLYISTTLIPEKFERCVKCPDSENSKKLMR